MFNIEDISDEENRMILSASHNYGDVFENAKKFISFLWSFYREPRENAWVSLFFLSQVQKSLYLALLSAIRKHDVQTNMMLRYSLESIASTCYAMYNPEVDVFIKIDSNGYMIEKRGWKTKAYQWLEMNYKEHNDKIKKMKGSINKFSTHSNLVPAFHNSEIISNGKLTIRFFDKEHTDLTKQRLWWIANVIFGALDLISKVNKDYPAFKLVEDFEIRMQHFGLENERIKMELKKSPIFSRHINI